MKCCEFCNKPLFLRSREDKKYCSDFCKNKAYKIKIGVLNGRERFNTSNGTTGAMGELAVAIDLLQKGYEVFRAISQSTSCDLIACKKNAKPLKFEVRSGVRNAITQKISFTKNKNDIGNSDHYAVVVWTDNSNEIVYQPELQSAETGSG